MAKRKKIVKRKINAGLKAWNDARSYISKQNKLLGNKFNGVELNELTRGALLEQYGQTFDINQVEVYLKQEVKEFYYNILDVSLSDLDQVVNGVMKKYETEGLIKQDIQAIRNITGLLSDHIIAHYDSIKPGCVEGVAVLWYVDKTFISSLWGDFMTHMSCKMELYQIINTLPHI